MRRTLLVVIGVLAVGFVALQFVPYRVDNPATRDEPKWDSPRTRQLAVRACYDCHSNESHVLNVEKVAPLSWWIANHVSEGRRGLNFSEWHTAAGRGAHDAEEKVQSGDMPPSNYTWLGLHSTAKLSAAEVRDLADGLKQTTAADPPSG